MVALSGYGSIFNFIQTICAKKKYLTNLIAIVPVFINDFLGPPYASIMREEKAITMVMATKCQIFLYTN